jgi:outer membrane protein OmpA-like peptidoglycan-associated protein
MNPDGITGYFASNRTGGRGGDDIYAFHRVPTLNVEGIVTDAINTKPIPGAKITLFDDKGNQIAYMETDENGFYQINIDRDKDYKIVASQEKYIDDYRNFTSKKIQTELTAITANLLLNPKPDVIKLAELNTIYFDYDKHNIRKDAALELDKIVNLMTNDYPEMVIRIESHTDSRGALSYNDRLSIDRANSTYEYLISKGVKAERITAHEGFGERRLTNGCEDGAKCEEADHQLNRRTQFIVIKME